jgi:hypothetical protein
MSEYHLNLTRFREFTPEELDELIDIVRRKHPAIDLTPRTIRYQFHGQSLPWQSAQKYNDDRERWVDEVRKALSLLPGRLTENKKKRRAKTANTLLREPTGRALDSHL